MIQNYKLLFHFVIWNIFVALVCLPTAGKMIDIFGQPVSVGILYFPFIYVISDLMTEVYGYAVARRTLWYTLVAQFAATLIFMVVLFLPPSDSFANNEAFNIVLGAAPQITLFGTIAIFAGDITNNYILAKLKVFAQGRYISLRLVLSTLGGQFVNTFIFFTFGLWGILPIEALVKSIILGTILKTGVEIIALPLTLRLIQWVKKVEGIDHYDTDTNFNPFKF